MSGTVEYVLTCLLIIAILLLFFFIAILLLPLLLTGPSSLTAEVSSFSPSGEWQAGLALSPGPGHSGQRAGVAGLLTKGPPGRSSPPGEPRGPGGGADGGSPAPGPADRRPDSLPAATERRAGGL